MKTEDLIRAINDTPNNKFYKQKYVPMNEWDEYNFQQEITKLDTDLVDDQRDFEKSLCHDDPTIYGTIVEKCIPRSKDSYNYRINHTADYCRDACLVLKYNSLEFDISERIKLLESDIILEQGGTPIITTTVGVNLFFCLLKGRAVIDEMDGEIRIPIVFFDLFPDCMLPVLQLGFHETRIILNLSSDIGITESYIEYVGVFAESETRRKAYQSSTEFISISCQKREFKSEDCKGSLATHFSLITKFVMFYFRPTKCYSQWDYCTSVPSLYGVDFSINDLEPLHFDHDQILSVEFMGIKMYILSLSPEVMNWKNMLDYFKSKKHTKHTFNGINFSKFNNEKFYLNTDVPIDDFDVCCTSIHHNIQIIRDGITVLMMSA